MFLRQLGDHFKNFTVSSQRNNNMLKPLSLKSTLFLIAFSLTFSTMPARADQPLPSPITTLLSFFASDFNPPKEGSPRQTVPAGSRDGALCHGDAIPMRPLMPEENYGLTASARPVIWMEIPNTQAQEILLVLQTETGIEHSRTQLPIPESTEQGIVQLGVPETVAELIPGENYRWTLSILCEGYLNPSDPFFSGWVKRVNYSSEVTQNLANESVVEQVSILQETGYWYDMLPLILQNQDTFSDTFSTLGTL